jgi:hypothetical protein
MTLMVKPRSMLNLFVSSMRNLVSLLRLAEIDLAKDEQNCVRSMAGLQSLFTFLFAL